MKTPAANPDLSKSGAQIFFEYFLFAVCLCVIALRATLTEGPNAPPAADPINLGSSLYSLSISALLILAFAAWLILAVCSSRFLYRLTAIEFGLGLFCAAAAISFFAAADKRAAINSFTCLAAPMLMAVLLVQILDSHSKIKLLLVLIAALGVLLAYQCQEQFFYWNARQIEFYEQDPAAALARQNITPHSLQHWQFEHRLYTRGVNGFFTTRNSAGAFALLSLFACLALALEKFRSRKSDATALLRLVPSCLAAAAVAFALVLTKSKAAIAASTLAAAMLIAFLRFGDWLKLHRKAILIVCLLFGVTVGGLGVWYGLTHDRLPGGSSMLVRWQYWCSTVKMYTDHLFTGAGPGNFRHLYTAYKDPAAAEIVSDPHNFLLSILAQYGPLGPLGFLAILLLPLYRTVCPAPAGSPPKPHRPGPPFKPMAVIFLIVISIALLLIRPTVLRLSPASSGPERTAAAIILYIVPVVVFVAAFLLLTIGEKTDEKRNTQYAIRNTNIAAAVLFCAVLGLLLHNLIDFAIFEPPVFTTLCAMIAAFVAMDFNRTNRTLLVLKPTAFVRTIVVAAALVIVWACFNYALVPTARATAKIARAHKASLAGRFEEAHELLSAAAEDDPFSAVSLSMNARLYLQRYKSFAPRQVDLLLAAEKSLLAAIDRSRCDYKNHQRLTEVYNLLAETSGPQTGSDWLNKAFEADRRAVQRYPGSGRLHLELAEIAEKLNQTDTALAEYKKAVDIEDAYRDQFEFMYPGRKIFSRLGEDRYDFAKQRIKQLKSQPTP